MRVVVGKKSIPFLGIIYKREVMKRIIAFSLWGEITYYTTGAIKNALLAKKYFPEWICRYYYDSSVPEDIISKLASFDNTELEYIEKESGAREWRKPGQFGMLWRFYVFNDDDVEIWMSRDTDSRLSPYERKYIDEFIKSDKKIHCFRDNSEPLLRGGMTSFKNYSVMSTEGPNLEYEDNRIVNGEKIDIKKMMDYIDQENAPFYSDEVFLKSKVLPIYKKDYCCNLRNDKRSGILFTQECGPYVGAIVDENDYHYNKSTNQIFVDNKWVRKR